MTGAVLDLNTFTGIKKPIYHLKFTSTNKDAFIYRQSVTPSQQSTGAEQFDFGKQKSEK